LNKVYTLLGPKTPARYALFRTNDGFAIVKNCMEGLFREKNDTHRFPLPRRQETLRAITTHKFEVKKPAREEYPSESPTSETPRPEIDDTSEVPDLIEGKVEVFRLALDLIIAALRDARNRRWFEVRG
jgi:hypothetical protein